MDRKRGGGKGEAIAAAAAPPAGLEPALRTIAMPADANPNGDIFGGWIMAQMDVAGAVLAVRRAKGRVVTVAVDAMSFHRPVYVGDLVSCYATIERVGRTSMTIDIATWVERRKDARHEKVTLPQARPPQSVVREAVEENTGEKFTFTEKLHAYGAFVPDKKMSDVDPATRGLAEVCLVLLNSNGFAFVY